MAKKDLEGFEELDAALAELQELTGKSGKPLLRRALVKSSHPIRDEAKFNAPWPSTESESKIKAATYYIDASGKRLKGKEDRHTVYSYVYDPHPLAGIFEYGTKERFQKTTGRHVGSIEPHFYMRSAADSKFDEVVDSQAKLIGEEIAKAFNKHAKKG